MPNADQETEILKGKTQSETVNEPYTQQQQHRIQPITVFSNLESGNS